MPPHGDQSGPPPGVRDLLTRVEAALAERQTLLAGPDTPAAQARIDTLRMRLAALLEQFMRVHPPAAVLED